MSDRESTVVSLNRSDWERQLGDLVSSIRSWPEWSTGFVQEMRHSTGTREQGHLGLYAYSRYVRNFITLMCAVLGKAPESDDSFWGLAINLHDELGGTTGIHASHGRMLAGLGDSLDATTRERCNAAMEVQERALHTMLATLDWPVNLFALGPGTESISDLFLDPLEHWGHQVTSERPSVRQYFDSHRPEVEAEHQLEIRRVIAHELARMSESDARSVWAIGVGAANSIARLHLSALERSFAISR